MRTFDVHDIIEQPDAIMVAEHVVGRSAFLASRDALGQQTFDCGAKRIEILPGPLQFKA
jgi:hypothetical protein